MPTKAEFDRAVHNAYHRGYQSGRRAAGREPQPGELAERYAALWRVAQRLQDRLSISNGWLYLFRRLLPREDTIPANRDALLAGKALGLGEE